MLFMGNRWPFSIAMLVITRGYYPWWFPKKQPNRQLSSVKKKDPCCLMIVGLYKPSSELGIL
jgi:hypothetical protein